MQHVTEHAYMRQSIDRQYGVASSAFVDVAGYFKS